MLVLQMRAHLRFAHKTRPGRRIMHKIGTNNFDRDGTTKGRELVGQVDFSHPPDVDTSYQFIIAKKRALCFFHSCQSVMLSHRSAFTLAAARRFLYLIETKTVLDYSNICGCADRIGQFKLV